MEKIEEIERLKKLLDEEAISRQEYLSLVEQVILKSDDLTLKDKKDESLPKKEQSDPTQHVYSIKGNTIIADTSQKQEVNAAISHLQDKTVLAGAKLKLSAVCQVWSRILAAITIILFMYNSGKLLTDLMTGMHNFNDISGSVVLISIFGLGSFICWVLSVVHLYNGGSLLESAGSLLESNVTLKTKDTSAKIRYKYNSDKGEIEIVHISNSYLFAGDLAYFNGNPAPDGKYKLDFMWYIYIKDGKVKRISLF
jgi:hypothetical protein